MHEEYSVSHFGLHVACNGKMQVGEYIVWSDRDVSDDNTFQYGNEAAMTLAMTHEGNRLANFADGNKQFSFPASKKWYYPFQTGASDERLVSPGNMYLMLVSPVAAVYGSAWVNQGMGATIGNGTVEIGKVFIDAKFQFRRPKAIEQYDDFHLSSGQSAALTAEVLHTSHVDLLQLNVVTGGPNSNVIAIDGNPIDMGPNAVNMSSGVNSSLHTTASTCMLNFGTATPNPKVYEVVVNVDLGPTGPTGGGTLYLWYSIGGVGQSLVSSGGPTGGQTITFPCFSPGSIAANTSSVYQACFVYYLYVPAGLPNAVIGTNSGARFQLVYVGNAAVTACPSTVDVLVKEAMFRPWDWTTFGDSVTMQRTAMPFRWWQIHKPAVQADDDEEKSNLPSLSMTSRRHFGCALDALVLDQDSPVVVQQSALKKKSIKKELP